MNIHSIASPWAHIMEEIISEMEGRIQIEEINTGPVSCHLPEENATPENSEKGKR